MKPDFKTWLIVGLTIFVILLILFQPPEPPDTTAWQDEIFRKELRIRQMTFLNKQDSLASAQKLAELNAKLSSKEIQVVKLTSNLERLKANPIVIHMRDSIEEIEATFQAYDSLLLAKDEELAIQDSKILVLEDENKRITANFLERLSLQADNLSTQKEIIDSQRKQLRKEKRRVKFLKVTTAVAAVGALFLGASF